MSDKGWQKVFFGEILKDAAKVSLFIPENMIASCVSGR